MNSTSPLIAIVDDEASIRRALARLLRASDMDVRSFDSGSAFLAEVETTHFDCAILDLHMSAFSGFDVQERLVRSGIWLPIIVMTGHDTPDARARALSGGMHRYLTKPIDGQVLLDAISSAIKSRNISR